MKKRSALLLVIMALILLAATASAEGSWEEAYAAFLNREQPESMEEQPDGWFETGNIYDLLYDVHSATAQDVDLRAWVTCDNPAFIAGQNAVITLHVTGGTAPYACTYTAWRSDVNATDFVFSNFGYYKLSFTDSFTFKPEAGWRYIFSVDVVDADGNYVTFQTNKFYTSATADASNTNTLYGKVKAIVAEVIVPGMTEWEKALALHDWLTMHARYDETYEEHRPHGVLLLEKGVCESYAMAYQLLLSEVGIENVYVTGTAGGDSHAWNLVKIDGKWLHVDATWDDPMVYGNTTPVSGYENHEYFCITDAVMAEDHTWNLYMNGGQVAPPAEDPMPEPDALPEEELPAGMTCADVSVPLGGTGVYTFTAEKAGCYTFSSALNDERRTCLRIVDGQGIVVMQDNVDGSQKNFRRAISLAAGETVTLYVDYVNTAMYGPVRVYITCDAAGVPDAPMTYPSDLKVGDTQIDVWSEYVIPHVFIAPEDGVYYFYTTGEKYFYATIRNEQGTDLADAYVKGEDEDYRITLSLLKGQKVLICVQNKVGYKLSAATLCITMDADKTLKKLSLGGNSVQLTGEAVHLVFSAPQDGTYVFSLSSPKKTLWMISVDSGTSTENEYWRTEDFESERELKRGTIVWLDVAYFDEEDTGTEQLHITLDGGTSLLILPSSLTVIGSEAFANTGADLIVIPAGCTQIAQDAFEGMSNLKVIYNYSNQTVPAPDGVRVKNMNAQ